MIPNPTPVISDICQINLTEADTSELPSDQPDPATTVSIVNGNTASLANTTSSPSLDKAAIQNLGKF